MLPLAPFNKLLPDTPLGWNDYHRAVDDWWRGPAAAFASSALPPGPSHEHEHALTHIALHVRRFPLRPRTPPLEDQGEIHVGGMPLVERWMREGWIRSAAGVKDQAVRWYRDVRDTARSDAGLKKLVKLMNDYRGSRKEVLDAAVSAWASESPVRVYQSPPVHHSPQMHQSPQMHGHYEDGPPWEPCQPGPSRQLLPQSSSSRSPSSRPPSSRRPLSSPPVSRSPLSPPPSRSPTRRYDQEPPAGSPSRRLDQEGSTGRSTKTTPDVSSRLTESPPDHPGQDDHPTSELRVVPVLRLRLPPVDVQAEIIELRRKLGEETTQREQAESKLGEGTIRREQAERKLGEETTRKEQAERQLREETTRRQQAERQLREDTDGRRSLEVKLEAETTRRERAESKFHQERLAGLKDLMAMSPGAQPRKDLSTLTRMELEARLAKNAEAKSADGRSKSRAEVVEFLDFLVESVRRGNSVPVGKRWSRQMIPIVLKSILKLAETDSE